MLRILIFIGLKIVELIALVIVGSFMAMLIWGATLWCEMIPINAQHIIGQIMASIVVIVFFGFLSYNLGIIVKEALRTNWVWAGKINDKIKRRKND